MELKAVYACAVAFFVAAIVTPLIARLARRVGAVDEMKERGLAFRATPLLGGLAIFIAVIASAAVFLPLTARVQAILFAAALIMIIGLIDDIVDLAAGWKLAGQVGAALICVVNGVRVDNITLPFIHHVDLGAFGAPLTVLGLVAVINVVNFSDGADGLAAGVCGISAAGFAIIAFDLHRDIAGVLAAIVAGAAVGFLVHNFHPASVFMGDSGSNLLGLLLGAVMVEGSIKTNAVIALFIPLLVLAVPFLDTGFVIAKRIKYGKPVYRADDNHFHHRFHRIGFSQRRTVAYLYLWTLTMTAVAVAMRFIPYTDDRGHFQTGWTIVLGGCFFIALTASVYLVYVLEIVKLGRSKGFERKKSSSRSQSDNDLVKKVRTHAGD